LHRLRAERAYAAEEREGKAGKGLLDIRRQT
jgi:hypothetical protein